ncbi:MAG: hypothetical protein KKG00_11270 [Bacteroidetes bacterium]|nr:hypothetical protein [Bacteroidota bacterium]
MKKKNNFNTNRVELLFEAFNEQTLADPAEARAHLVEEGKNPQVIVQHGMALVNRLKAQAELAIAKQKTYQRYQHAKQQVIKQIKTISNPIEYLTSLLAQRGQTTLQANFRKAKSLSPEELIDMIDEVELLYIFDELEKTNPSINE